MRTEFEIKKRELNNYWLGIIAELSYSRYYLISIAFVIGIFCFVALFDMPLFKDSIYFWTGIISMAIYLSLLFMYMKRHREKRDRFLLQLTNSLEGLIQQKITVVFLLLTVIVGAFFILKILVSDSWDPHITGIIRQFGLFTTFLAGFSIITDIKSIFPRIGAISYNLIILLLIIIMVAVQIFVLVYWPEKLVIEEIAFLSWGSILIIISQLIHYFKKSFL